MNDTYINELPALSLSGPAPYIYTRSLSHIWFQPCDIPPPLYIDVLVDNMVPNKLVTYKEVFSF